MQSAKVIRLFRRKSQFEISLLTGIPNYRLSLLENGKAEPTHEELEKLANALGTSAAVLKKDASHLIGSIM